MTRVDCKLHLPITVQKKKKKKAMGGSMNESMKNNYDSVKILVFSVRIGWGMHGGTELLMSFFQNILDHLY